MGAAPIKNRLRQYLPRGGMKVLTQPIPLQWVTRGGVVTARVPSMHAIWGGGDASPNIGSAEQARSSAVCLFFLEKLLDMRLATGGDVSAKKK